MAMENHGPSIRVGEGLLTPFFTPTGPIALAEVQAYVYGAKCLAAVCARHLGREEQGATLAMQAAELADRFEAAFWCPELETYSPALDGLKRPCRTRTSVAGNLLFTGIAAPERARHVGHGLLRPDFFSGWGIRTCQAKRAVTIQCLIITGRCGLMTMR
jgi:glycogen debranching enzyme